jgi:hypothetical protein
LRESEEEIGLDRALVTPLGYLDCFETISGFCITPVVARIARRSTLYPAPDEVAEVFEVPLAFFLEPDNLRAMSWNFADIDARWWSSTMVVTASGAPPPRCCSKPVAEDGARMKTTLISVAELAALKR